MPPLPYRRHHFPPVAVFKKWLRLLRPDTGASIFSFTRCAACGIIPLRSRLGGEAEANAREHVAQRDARLQPFGRAREKGVAHWPVTRSRPVVHLRERLVTG